MYVCVQGRAHMDIRGQPVGVSSTTSVLETELRSSGLAARILTCWHLVGLLSPLDKIIR